MVIFVRNMQLCCFNSVQDQLVHTNTKAGRLSSWGALDDETLVAVLVFDDVQFVFVIIGVG